MSLSWPERAAPWLCLCLCLCDSPSSKKEIVRYVEVRWNNRRAALKRPGARGSPLLWELIRGVDGADRHRPLQKVIPHSPIMVVRTILARQSIGAIARNRLFPPKADRSHI